MDLIASDEGRAVFRSIPKRENEDAGIEEYEELVLTRDQKFSYSFKRTKDTFEDYDFETFDYYSRGDWNRLDYDTKSAILKLDVVEKTGGPESFIVELNTLGAKSEGFKYRVLGTVRPL